MKKRNLPYFDPTLGKLPPQCVDIEDELLGQIMANSENKRVIKVLKSLSPKIFYKDSNKLIAEGIINLFHSKEPIDILTVTERLRKLGILDEAGGPYAVAQKVMQSHPIMMTANKADSWYYYLLITQKYLQREIIRISSHYNSRAFSDDFEIFDELDVFIEELKKISKYKEIEGKSITLQDQMKTVLQYMSDAAVGAVKTIWKTGMPNTDKILGISPNIMVLAGDTGAGKTTFLTFLIKKLLEENKDIAVYWRCLDHDTTSQIIRKFISNETNMTEADLLSKNDKMDEAKLNLVMAVTSKISEMTIEFSDVQDSLRDIGRYFENFCDKHKEKKLKILVIDNIARVLENKNNTSNEIDDNIANSIADIHKETSINHNTLVIYLHHFTKEQASTSNLDMGNMPTKEMIRGSKRYTDLPTQICLVNRPGAYPNLMIDYKGKKDILEKIFIVDIVKNSNNETGRIYFYCDLGKVKFLEL